VDHCESNYQMSLYIAEPLGCAGSVCILISGLWLLHVNGRLVPIIGRTYIPLLVILCSLGLSGALFHATLKLGWQFLNQILETCMPGMLVFFLKTKEWLQTGESRHHIKIVDGIVILGIIFFSVLVVGLSSSYVPWLLLQCECMCLVHIFYFISKVPESESTLRCILRRGAYLYIVSMVIRSVDRYFCEEVQPFLTPGLLVALTFGWHALQAYSLFLIVISMLYHQLYCTIEPPGVAVFVDDVFPMICVQQMAPVPVPVPLPMPLPPCKEPGLDWIFSELAEKVDFPSEIQRTRVVHQLRQERMAFSDATIETGKTFNKTIRSLEVESKLQAMAYDSQIKAHNGVAEAGLCISTVTEMVKSDCQLKQLSITPHLKGDIISEGHVHNNEMPSLYQTERRAKRTRGTTPSSGGDTLQTKWCVEGNSEEVESGQKFRKHEVSGTLVTPKSAGGSTSEADWSFSKVNDGMSCTPKSTGESTCEEVWSFNKVKDTVESACSNGKKLVAPSPIGRRILVTPKAKHINGMAEDLKSDSKADRMLRTLQSTGGSTLDSEWRFDANSPEGPCVFSTPTDRRSNSIADVIESESKVRHSFFVQRPIEHERVDMDAISELTLPSVPSKRNYDEMTNGTGQS